MMIQAFMAIVFVLVSAVDARSFRIPDVLLAYVLLFASCGDVARGDGASVAYRTISAAVAFLVLSVVWFRAGGMGFGDVKLVGVLAYCYGLQVVAGGLALAALAGFAWCLAGWSGAGSSARPKYPYAPLACGGCALYASLLGRLP